MTKSQDDIAAELTKLRGIASEIIDIRKRVGADPVDFPRNSVLIDDDLISISGIEELFHHPDSPLLIDRGMPVFVYIRDHMYEGYQGPKQAKKIHFTKCETLQDMMRQGKFQQRYRKTNRDDNRYLIDVPKDSGGSKEKIVALYPCENCLEEVSYQCFPPRKRGGRKRSSEEREEIEKIKKNFDAKVAFALIGQVFEIFSRDIAKSRLSSASSPAGYSSFWEKISGAIRRSKNYTCEQCGVRLQDNPECLDVHHRDHDKQNILNSNLICLCKCCHARQHKHYRLSDHCKELIKREQVFQKTQRTCP